MQCVQLVAFLLGAVLVAHASVTLQPVSKTLSVTVNTVAFRLLGCIDGRPVLRYRNDPVSEESSPSDVAFFAYGPRITDAMIHFPMPVHTIEQIVSIDDDTTFAFCGSQGSKWQRSITNSSGSFHETRTLSSEPCRRVFSDASYIYVWNTDAPSTLRRFFSTGMPNTVLSLAPLADAVDATVLDSMLFATHKTQVHSAEKGLTTVSNTTITNMAGVEMGTYVSSVNATSVQMCNAQVCLFNEYIQAEFSLLCHLARSV